MRKPAPPWTLVRTATFLRDLRKYLKKHPQAAALVRDTLNLLVADPHSPALRLHPLQGRLKGVLAVRLTYGDRITLTLCLSERQIILLGIGTHDALYH